MRAQNLLPRAPITRVVFPMACRRCIWFDLRSDQDGTNMNKNIETNLQVPSLIEWRKRRLRVLLVPALLLPLVQTAQAVDIYYARAIGHDFLPDTAPSKSSAPANPGQARQPELPGLGTQTETTPTAAAAGAGMSTWSKVLIGAVVVGAIAALANKGGGGGGDTGSSGSGSSQNTGTSGSGGGSGGSSPPPSGGGAGPGIGIGGGGISVGGR